MTRPDSPPLYSIIVLLEEWHAEFPSYIERLYRQLSSRPQPFEILIMDNASGGQLKHELVSLQTQCQCLRAFELRRKVPQAVSLKSGFKHSRGDIIITCGSYQQITTESFGKLLDAMDEQTDVISPWRQQRVDAAVDQFQSNLFNRLVKFVTGSPLNDLSCTVKLFRREVLEHVDFYGNMYRFLPILAMAKGYRCKEVACRHQQEFGKSGFFGFRVYLMRLVDILTLYFITHFSRKPMRFFSTVGSGFFALGIAVMAYVVIQKLIFGYPFGGRPVVALAILFIVLGVQVGSAGLLGEIVSFTYGRKRKAYTIEKKI
jgi:hypothetical protein